MGAAEGFSLPGQVEMDSGRWHVDSISGFSFCTMNPPSDFVILVTVMKNGALRMTHYTDR